MRFEIAENKRTKISKLKVFYESGEWEVLKALLVPKSRYSEEKKQFMTTKISSDVKEYCLNTFAFFTQRRARNLFTGGKFNAKVLLYDPSVAKKGFFIRDDISVLPSNKVIMEMYILSFVTMIIRLKFYTNMSRNRYETSSNNPNYYDEVYRFGRGNIIRPDLYIEEAKKLYPNLNYSELLNMYEDNYPSWTPRFKRIVIQDESFKTNEILSRFRLGDNGNMFLEVPSQYDNDSDDDRNDDDGDYNDDDNDDDYHSRENGSW